MKAFIYINNVTIFIVACLFAIFASPWIWIVAAWIAIWLVLDFYKGHRIDRAWQKLRELSSKNVDG